MSANNQLPPMGSPAWLNMDVRDCIGSSELPATPGSARAWQCNLGNGEWDHDWQEKHDSTGEVDGGPGDHYSWRECRVCGEIEAPNAAGER